MRPDTNRMAGEYPEFPMRSNRSDARSNKIETGCTVPVLPAGDGTHRAPAQPGAVFAPILLRTKFKVALLARWRWRATCRKRAGKVGAHVRRQPLLQRPFQLTFQIGCTAARARCIGNPEGRDRLPLAATICAALSQVNAMRSACVAPRRWRWRFFAAVGCNCRQNDRCESFAALSVNMRVQLATHTRRPESLQVDGDLTGRFLFVWIGGEKGADLVGHGD
jgi:hypothetical protein